MCNLGDEIVIAHPELGQPAAGTKGTVVKYMLGYFAVDVRGARTYEWLKPEQLESAAGCNACGPIPKSPIDKTDKVCNNTYTMSKKAPQTMTELLRQAINEADSFKGIERETGVTRQSLMKFARGEQSLRLDIADRLAAHFGIVSRKEGE